MFRSDYKQIPDASAESLLVNAISYFTLANNAECIEFEINEKLLFALKRFFDKFDLYMPCLIFELKTHTPLV